MIVYSPSDRLVNSELSNQEDLLQYLYTRAQMDESANPHLLAIYGDTSNVPVSITVDGLQPNTPYLIFVQVEMLYQVGTLYHTCAGVAYFSIIIICFFFLVHNNGLSSVNFCTFS